MVNFNENTINKLHKELILEFGKYAGHGTKHSGNARYLGNAHFSYHISNPIRRKIAKAFLVKRKEMSQRAFFALLDALYKGKSHDEKSMAGMLLGYAQKHRAEVPPALIDQWLNYVEGWAEVDSLCQSNFTAVEMLSHWKEWNRLLNSLSKSKNINKRRASLVLLTGPVAKSEDKRLSSLAFGNISRLQGERHILITKAISWLLRSLTIFHRKEVVVYLKGNEMILPRVAIWETKRKLETRRR